MLRQVLAHDHACHGQVPAHALAEGNHVRLHPGVFDGPHPAGAAGARLHLVRDKQGAVLFTGGLYLQEEFGRRRHVAPLSLHRLNDHGRHVVRRRVRRIQQVVHVIAADLFAGLVPERQGKTVGVGVRRMDDTAHEGAITRAILLAGGKGVGSRPDTVVGAVEGQDLVAPGHPAGKLDGAFQRAAAALGEIADTVVPETRRCDGGNLLCQFAALGITDV